ncbi:MAG: hypothetical protein GY713_12735 [Actinomycetia bacterium]|nr:hypothetical protein [Actinomycetes bacterium]
MAGALFGILGLLAPLLVLAGAQPSAAGPGDHGQVVPSTPRSDTPVVLDGKVYAHALLGDRVVVGGSFTQIELADGSITNQPYLFAYDVNTGAFDPSFDPVLDKEVLDVEASDLGDGVFIAGRFTQIDGVEKGRVAKLTPQGEIDTRFNASVDAKVLAIDDDGSRLYLGGNFTTANGSTRSSFAAVHAVTGSLDALVAELSGPLGQADSGAVRSLDVHPDGSALLIAHSSRYVNGAHQPALAQIDLATNTVTGWQTDWYWEARHRCTEGAVQVRDAEYSPDGSYFVVTEKGAYLCDKVVAFPTADTAGLEENLWVTAAFDSVYSVGVSDTAVYVGGHFCFLDDLGPIRTADVAAYPFVDKPAACAPGGNQDTDGVAARYQVAALDPATGDPMGWNPGVNSQEAVFDLEVIERGLLLGHDRDQFGGTITGRHSFLDFGGFTPSLPPPMVASEGYWLLETDGDVHGFGGAAQLGIGGGSGHVDIEGNPTGDGYWVVDSAGLVTARGSAPHLGDLVTENTALAVGEKAVSISTTATGDGYWIFTSLGRTVPFGDAVHHGDLTALSLNAPVIDSMATVDGTGYWLVAADGGVFGLGSAGFHGSMGGILLNQPVVGLAPTANGQGYWLVAADGGVFAFGDALFGGSMGGHPLNQPMVGLVPYGTGYFLVAADGGVFVFSDLPFEGSLGENPPDSAIVSATARREPPATG